MSSIDRVCDPQRKISPSHYRSCIYMIKGGPGSGTCFSVVKKYLHIHSCEGWEKCILDFLMAQFGAYLNIICYKNVHFLHKPNDSVTAACLL